jgi:prevent-host-death family protein
MRPRTVNATEFKAKCLSFLDHADKGETITVTKRGRAVAILHPVKSSAWKSPAGAWSGKVEIAGDIVTHDTAPLWEALRKRPARRPPTR